LFDEGLQAGRLKAAVALEPIRDDDGYGVRKEIRGRG